MSEPAPLRAIRAGASASVCVAVSVGGHLAASGPGAGVPPAGLLLGALVALGSAWALTGRERRWGTITGWMLWGQLALHLLFSATAAGHGHGSAFSPAEGGAGMLAAHLAAAALCAWWLRQGEAALFSYLRSRAAACFPLLRPVVVRVPAAPPLPRPVERPVPVPAAPYLRHSLALRAPPPSSRTR
ncbi:MULTISPECIES: hypothetical protein [unclassified Nocardiopsis]|uniref:hypothetical protein n=1 Tax=Nocardiopsis TaxID=2013 RepID=UPI00387B440F